MEFKLPVKKGRFLKRYKRFFADLDYKGQTLTAHLPNTGSLKGVFETQIPCLFTVTDDPKRKLKYTLQMVQGKNSWIGVNTQWPNHLVWEAWEKGKIPSWRTWKKARKEVSLPSRSRVDLVFEDRHFVEVKNVTWAEGKKALFPDSVTKRGQKHLRELMALKKQGLSAEMVFVVQRTDCEVFSPAEDIDPKYAELLRQAFREGVQISVYGCLLSLKGIELNPLQKIKMKL